MTEPPKIPAELKLARGVTSGRVQLVAVCRKLALEEGTTLDVMLWDVVKSSPGDGAKDAEVTDYVRSPEYAAEVARVLGELDGGVADDEAARLLR